MRVVLEISSGPGTGQKVEVRPGQVLKVGRSNQADYAIPYDTFLSGRHFSLEIQGGKCLLRDLRSSNGTTVNGKRVSKVELSDGDQVIAGRTVFTVFIVGIPEVKAASDQVEVDVSQRQDSQTKNKETLVLPKSPFEDPEEARKEALKKETAEKSGFAGAEDSPPLTQPQTQLLKILWNQQEPLFAVFDSARDEAILDCLLTSEERYETLFEGGAGRELFDYSPFLVSFTDRSQLLKFLVRKAWGQSWGVYLACSRPFDEVRAHCRQRLMVEISGGKSAYFRFYDPRVLRSFLPTCDSDQRLELFGPISYFLMESEKPAVFLRFLGSQENAERIELVGRQDRSCSKPRKGTTNSKSPERCK